LRRPDQKRQSKTDAEPNQQNQARRPLWQSARQPRINALEAIDDAHGSIFCNCAATSWMPIVLMIAIYWSVIVAVKV
jgi:hypothetical protein